MGTVTVAQHPPPLARVFLCPKTSSNKTFQPLNPADRPVKSAENRYFAYFGFGGVSYTDLRSDARQEVTKGGNNIYLSNLVFALLLCAGKFRH